MKKFNFRQLLVLVALMTASTAMAIDFPKVGKTPVDGGKYVLVSYVNPNNYFSRTSWDGAYYLLPYADSQFASHAFTAHQEKNGTWYFSIVTTNTYTNEEDGTTYTEEETSYIGFHEPSNDNLNAKLGYPAYYNLQPAEVDGFYRVIPGAEHGNPAVEGIPLHLNASGQYLICSESSCGFFPDVWGGVKKEIDDAGYEYVVLDENDHCIPLDTRSELWAFADPDELPAFKNALELYAELCNFENQMNALTDDTFKPGFQGGLNAALAFYKSEVSDEDLAAAKAILQAKQNLYNQIVASSQVLADEPDADLQAAIEKATADFNSKNTVEELEAALAELNDAQTRHDMGQGNLTRLGKNMSFEDLSSQGGNTTSSVADVPAGWNLYVRGNQVQTADDLRANGINGWAGINADGSGMKDGQMIYGIWNSGIPEIELSQTISGLETGTYIVQAAMMVGANGNGSRRTTQRIFGNLNVKFFSQEGGYNTALLDPQEVWSFEGLEEPVTDTELQEMSVRAFVFDGTLTFGLRTNGNIAAANRTESNGAGGDGWFKVDNFRILKEGYVQEDALAVYEHFRNALDELLREPLQQAVFDETAALLDKTTCGQSSTADEIVAAIKALMGMMPKVKSSVEAYQTLQKAIDQAYDNLYEYSNYAGAGAFNDLIMEAEDMYAEATANEEQIAEMIKRLDDGFLELKLSGVAVGIYVTNLMKNPGFEDLSAQGGVDSNGSANPPAGWDLYINDEKQTSAPPVGWCGINGGDDISFAGLYDEEGNPITVQYVEGTHLWGIWNGNIPNVELSQTLTGLPNGTYVLSANVMVQYQWAGNCLTTQRLFANDCVQMFGTEEEHAVNLPTDAQEANKTEGHLTYAGYTCTQDDPYTNTLRPMEVRFYVTDGTAKLGFRTNNINPDGTADTSTGHGWFKLDNFQLFYESEEIPEGIEGISESKGSVVSQRFFSADGRQQRSLSRGLNIVETRLSDGTVKTSKVIVK